MSATINRYMDEILEAKRCGVPVYRTNTLYLPVLNNKFYFFHDDARKFNGVYIYLAGNGSIGWGKNGKCHRDEESGPAKIQIGRNAQGKIVCDLEWCKDGKLHRTDGPAVENHDGGKQYCIEGRVHRDGEPAVITSYGLKVWYRNDRYMRDNRGEIVNLNLPRMLRSTHPDNKTRKVILIDQNTGDLYGQFSSNGRVNGDDEDSDDDDYAMMEYDESGWDEYDDDDDYITVDYEDESDEDENDADTKRVDENEGEDD